MSDKPTKRQGPLLWLAAQCREFLSDSNRGIAKVGGGLLLWGAVFLRFTPILWIRENIFVPFLNRGTAQIVIDVVSTLALASMGLGIAMLGVVIYRLTRGCVASIRLRR